MNLRALNARLYWKVTGVTLGIAALIGISAVLGAGAGDTEARIIGTMIAVLVGGGLVVAGLSLVDSGVSVRGGYAAAATAPVLTTLIIVALWADHNMAWRIGGSAALILVVGLLIVTGRAVAGRRARLVQIWSGAAVLLIIALGLTVIPIWHIDGLHSGYAKLTACVWILGVLCYLLIPVVKRTSAPEAQISEVKRVDLKDGIEFGRHPRTVREASGDEALAVGTREELYVVLGGRLTIDGIAAGPGEGILVPAGSAHGATRDDATRVLVVA